MQRWFFFFVFSLLVEPLATQAQQAMPLASLDNRCSVPVDPHWTDQEKFVWQHVCIGKVADFNTAPGYGGEFAPKSRTAGNKIVCCGRPFSQRSC